MSANNHDRRAPTVYVPKLVTRCRQFGEALAGSMLWPLWRSLGILESIEPPTDRTEEGGKPT